MKQKGLCRALLLILFATCAVAGQAQEVLRSDSVTGVDAGKESLKIQPSASEVTPEKVGARLALTDTLVTDTAQWTFRPSLPPLYRNGTVAYFPASYYGGHERVGLVRQEPFSRGGIRDRNLCHVRA